ncbi:hypothetical protein ACTSKR_12675 [Chitinibacteraceae bacterium HSL-7]
MKKIAVFGKPGSGKSTLSKALSRATGVPFHPLDVMAYHPDGTLLDRSSFDDAHRQVLLSDQWIIDGLGPLSSFNERLMAADTLIYIDLPYRTSYWLVTKRLLKGALVHPEGWPEGSALWKGTLASYRFLRLSPQFWNAALLQRLEAMSTGKSLHVIRSLSELEGFVEAHVPRN